MMAELLSAAELKTQLAHFHQHFPTEVIKIVTENQGFVHRILVINDLWICKIPKDPANTQHSAALAVEAELLKALQGKLTTPIPVVAYVAPNFLVYQQIPGTELTAERYADLSQPQKAQLAHDIAYFLYELHRALSIAEAKQIGLMFNDWPWSPAKLIQQADLLTDPALKKIFTAFIKDYGDPRAVPNITLIHNDMICRNIIIDPQTGRLNGIIDFTDAAIDDPYIDLRLNYLSVPALSAEIAVNYAQLTGDMPDLKKIYRYYLATEFSRYLEYLSVQNLTELPIVKARIIQAANYLQL